LGGEQSQMDAKLENGRDEAPPERKRAGISLSAPDVKAPEAKARGAEGGGSPAARSPEVEAPDAEAAAANRTYSVHIPPMGESAVVGTALRGYTLIHMTNLSDGDSEADVTLTWMGKNGPEIAQMFTNRPMGFEYYRDLFWGAKVAITNLSTHSTVRIRVTLCP